MLRFLRLRLLLLLNRGSVRRRSRRCVATGGNRLRGSWRDGCLQDGFLYLSALNGLHDDRRLCLGLPRAPSLQRSRPSHRSLCTRRYSGNGDRTWRSSRCRAGIDSGGRTLAIILLRLRRALSVLYRGTVRWWLDRAGRRRRNYRVRRWRFNLSIRVVTVRLIYTESLYLLRKLLLNLGSVLNDHRLTIIRTVGRTRHRTGTPLR